MKKAIKEMEETLQHLPKKGKELEALSMINSIKERYPSVSQIIGHEIELFTQKGPMSQNDEEALDIQCSTLSKITSKIAYSFFECLEVLLQRKNEPQVKKELARARKLWCHQVSDPIGYTELHIEGSSTTDQEYVDLFKALKRIK